MIKKILAFTFLGLLTANLNLYSVKEEEINQKIEQEEMPDRDKLKIAAASIGCAFFTIATFMAYPTFLKTHSITSEEMKRYKH